MVGKASFLKAGIRREDKNVWERRVPLVPEHVGEFVREGFSFALQPSQQRIFPDDAYTQVGAHIEEDLSSCDVVFGVKEMPIAFFQPEKTYVFFAHVIKGQPYNMPMLKKLLELGCTLIDYEKIVDRRGRRLVFFGVHAGIAGMLDTFWALGRRLEAEGVHTYFTRCKRALEYGTIARARQAYRELARTILEQGIPEKLRPFVIGIMGYGHSARGVSEICDLLPHISIPPEELSTLSPDAPESERVIFKVTFEKHHMYEHKEGKVFSLEEFQNTPQRYKGGLYRYLPYVTILMNCIYWEPRFPVIVTREDLCELYSQSDTRLKVIGDVTCDIRGSLSSTIRATTPGDPVYLYDPELDQEREGFSDHGPLVLAVDNLPCEIPYDASMSFSKALYPFVREILMCDYSLPYPRLRLSPAIHGAVICHQGELTPSYTYLERFLE